MPQAKNSAGTDKGGLVMASYLDSLSVKPDPDFNQLLKVLRREGKPDYVPFYELFANGPVMEKIIGKKISKREDTLEFYYRMGYDYIPCWPSVPMDAGSLVDRRGGYPISDRKTFERYRWPSVQDIIYKEFEIVAPLLPAGMKIIGQTGGVFECAEGLCGYERLCYMLVDDRKLLHEVFERIEDIYVSMYNGMAKRDEVGAVVISDDLGYKTHTLISPADLREFVLPLHRKLADIIHSHGKPCILHSCGQLAEIMEDIIDYVGIDAKHSYEDAIMPVTEFKKRYGNRIAVLGGFDVDLLTRSSVEKVRAHTRFLLSELGNDGGYALGSGNSIADFVPVENYLAMLDEAWKLR